MNSETFIMYLVFGTVVLSVLGIIYFVIRYYFFPKEYKPSPIKKTPPLGLYEVIKKGDGKWVKK